MVHIIGITKFGIHSFGFNNVLNHSILKLTKMLPISATKSIERISIIIYLLFLKNLSY